MKTSNITSTAAEPRSKHCWIQALSKSMSPRSSLNKTDSYTILPAACLEKHSPATSTAFFILFFFAFFLCPLRGKQIHPLMGNEIYIAVLTGTESVNHRVTSQACRNGRSLKFPCCTGLGYSSPRSAKERIAVNNPLIWLLTGFKKKKINSFFFFFSLFFQPLASALLPFDPKC